MYMSVSSVVSRSAMKSQAQNSRRCSVSGSPLFMAMCGWEHSCKDGQYSSAKVHRSVHVVQKETAQLPSSVEDYVITMEELPGLTPVIIDGV